MWLFQKIPCDAMSVDLHVDCGGGADVYFFNTDPGTWAARRYTGASTHGGESTLHEPVEAARCLGTIKHGVAGSKV